MIEESKSSQPEVKADKKDKRLQSYGHLKFGLLSHFNILHVLWTSLTLTIKDVDTYLSQCRRLLEKIFTSLLSNELDQCCLERPTS